MAAGRCSVPLIRANFVSKCYRINAGKGQGKRRKMFLRGKDLVGNGAKSEQTVTWRRFFAQEARRKTVKNCGFYMNFRENPVGF